ncbi:hypothetical protein [Duganella sp. BJB1802]|uniref:hypothetical protein n=1 Tax=Duganella sp. BJB1802 TaxID=2744575 RepID=UPI001E2EC73F|nr:hypothetical protein [Duganella sp. BJB1802]
MHLSTFWKPAERFSALPSRPSAADVDLRHLLARDAPVFFTVNEARTTPPLTLAARSEGELGVGQAMAGTAA